MVGAGIDASNHSIFMTICLSSGPSNLKTQGTIASRVSQFYFDHTKAEQEPKDTQT